MMNCTHCLAKSRGSGKRAVVLAILFLALMASLAIAAELKLDTIQAFDRYVKITEEERAASLRRTNAFLWIDRQPEVRRRKIYDELKGGGIVVQRLETRDDNRLIQIPNGLVHHWVGAIFIPGATMYQMVDQMQNYTRYPELFKFGVDRSKVLSRDTDQFHVQLRMFRKARSSIFYNAELDDRYSLMDATRAYRRTRSTRIVELADVGKPTEHELPVGNDHGLLWRLNINWNCEEKEGGVFLEAELIALSRNVPAIFAWLVNPYIRAIPQEYLENVLGAMRSNLEQKASGKGG